MINRREMIGVGLAGFIPFEGKAMKDKSTELLSKINFLQPHEVFSRHKLEAGVASEYPLDFIFPNSFIQYNSKVIPAQGRKPERSMYVDYVTVPTYEIGSTLENCSSGNLDLYTNCLKQLLLNKVNLDAHNILYYSIKAKVDCHHLKNEDKIVQSLEKMINYKNKKYTKFIHNNKKYISIVDNSKDAYVMPIRQKPTLWLFDYRNSISAYMEYGMSCLHPTHVMAITDKLDNELNTNEEMLLPYKDILNG